MKLIKNRLCSLSSLVSKVTFVILSLTLLSNCGYHLKTQQETMNIHIVSNSDNTLVQLLKKRLDTTQNITKQLQIFSVKQSQQSISSNNQGQTSSLKLSVQAQIKLSKIIENKTFFKGVLQKSQIINISNNSSVDEVQKETTFKQLYNELIEQIFFKINHAN